MRATLTVARTDTRGCLRVYGEPFEATLAHGRAGFGAGGARFGITVCACASSFAQATGPLAVAPHPNTHARFAWLWTIFFTAFHPPLH